MASSPRVLDFTLTRSPGPVAEAYYRDWRRVVDIMGPTGGGKTITTAKKCGTIAIRQRKSSRDGLRKVKGTAVAVDYRRLWKNLLPSWFKVVPKDVGDWHGGEGEPSTHVITFGLPDGSKAQLTMDFIAIGDHAAEDAMRGYEPTFIWLFEKDRHSHETFLYALNRVGRFPDMSEGGPSWYGVLGDLNAPDIGTWYHTELYEKRLELGDFFGFHRQPSGFSPQAENLHNLPPGYYAEQAKGQPDWFVRRMLRNEFGYSRDGKPVFPEFSEHRHVAGAVLEPVRGIPLRIGMDAGGTPAATIRQHMPNGQRRVLACVVTDPSDTVGATRFSEMVNRVLGTARFAGWPRKDIIARCDPSAAYGGDERAPEASGERSWMHIVRHRTGLDLRPARTNDPTIRTDAVRKWMTVDVEPDVPGFVISPDCVPLIRGYASEYRYRRILGPSGGFADKPDKNGASHVADADQYAELTDDGYLELMGRKSAGVRGQLQTRAIDDSDPEHGRGEWQRTSGGVFVPDGKQSSAIE